jgi:hypothetical protein
VSCFREAGKLKLPTAHPPNDSEIVPHCSGAQFTRSQALENSQVCRMLYGHCVCAVDTAVHVFQTGIEISRWGTGEIQVVELPVALRRRIVRRAATEIDSVHQALL